MTGWDRSLGLPALCGMWQHLKLSDVSRETRPRYNLVVDEDVKKPNRQTNQKSVHHVYSRIPGIIEKDFNLLFDPVQSLNFDLMPR